MLCGTDNISQNIAMIFLMLSRTFWDWGKMYCPLLSKIMAMGIECVSVGWHNLDIKGAPLGLYILHNVFSYSLNNTTTLCHLSYYSEYNTLMIRFFFVFPKHVILKREKNCNKVTFKLKFFYDDLCCYVKCPKVEYQVEIFNTLHQN